MTACRKAVICRGAQGRQQHPMAAALLFCYCVILKGPVSRGAVQAGTGRGRRGKSRGQGSRRMG